MNLIKKITQEREQFEKNFDEKYTKQLTEAIKDELDKAVTFKIEFGYKIQFADGEHCDYINYVNKDGTLVMYNNEDCDPSGLAHDDLNVLDGNWSVDHLAEVLEAVTRYNIKNPKPKLVKQVIPPVQMEIVQRALNVYEKALQQQDLDKHDDIADELFDILTLRGLLKGEVAVVHPKDRAESFSFFCGVDWPAYTDEFPRIDLD